jgi:hypothetical protein
VTLSPEPPGIFRFVLAPAGAGPGAGGPPVGDRARRLQGCTGAARCVPAELYPPLQYRDLGLGRFQCQLLVKTLFHITWATVSQRAVQAMVVVIKLYIFEDLTPGLAPGNLRLGSAAVNHQLDCLALKLLVVSFLYLLLSHGLSHFTLRFRVRQIGGGSRIARSTRQQSANPAPED